MISIPGELIIRTVNGRYGEFNVGNLRCSIGEFTVKDASIEEFEEGSYTGNFVISQIRPSSYFTGGRLVVEIRAHLNSIVLDDMNLGHVEGPALDQDPVEEETAKQSNQENNVEQACIEVSIDSSEDTQKDDDPMAVLFGELWPLRNVVKLDPTVDRANFRKQRDYLKNRGYNFDAKKQYWVGSTEEGGE